MPDVNPRLRLRPEIAQAALAGLTAAPKTLPSKLFYDDVGSALFERITRLPEYYVTRVELALLRRIALEASALLPSGAVLVEYGAGSEVKAEILLCSLRDPAAYVAIDVAREAIAAAGARLRSAMPRLPSWTVEADFLAPLDLPPDLPVGPRIGFFPGSTIGNFEPPVAVRFLRQMRETLGHGASLLIGFDLRKSADLLIPAYDDAEGVTAEFNLNILTRLNRDAGADFDVSKFQHRIVWNADDGRIEMHLESLQDQVAHVGGRAIRFAEGETIHTENSYKHTRAELAALASEAGWSTAEVWTDRDELFAISLLRAGDAR
jgi:dimethylhistidine N-methyltransferase